MKRFWIPVISLAAALLGPSPRAAAQTEAVAPEEAVILPAPRPRQGYYFSFALLAGRVSAHRSGPEPTPFPAGGFSFRVGEVITERLSLGFGIDLGGAMDAESEGSFAGLSIESEFEFLEHLSARAGVGLGVVNPGAIPAKTGSDSQGGAFFGAGLAYDWFVFEKEISGGLALRPSLQVRLQPGSDVFSTLLLFGLELTFWTGLPKNELELPVDRAYSR